MRIDDAFSLVELLLVLLLFSSLFIGIPHFNSLLERQRVKSELEKFAQACEFARQMAMIIRIPIIICHSKSMKQCDGIWNDGFIVFADFSGGHLINENNKILRIHTNNKNLPGKFSWKGFLSTEYLKFNPSYFFDLGMAGEYQFTPYQGRNLEIIKIVINNAGKLHFKK